MRKITFILLAAGMVAAASQRATAQKAAEQTRAVSDFTKISSAGPFRVHITLGDKESVRLVVDSDLINLVETKVDNHTLFIRFKEHDGVFSYHLYTADIYVTAKKLDGLLSSGSGIIDVDGELRAANFKAAIIGSGDITARINSAELDASLSGSGTMHLSGHCDSTFVRVTGSGELKAMNLNSGTASVMISGSGNVYVKPEKQLTSSILGSGSVFYSGTAVIQTAKVGSGRVVKVE